MPVDVFKFRALDSIGANGAEEDEYLSECFVDTGLIGSLQNPNDRHILLLGRTGAGKTALLRTLEAKRPIECIPIAPESLALTYVSNSTILSFFAGLGVNLDPFFKLLWRHIIVVEVLSRHVAGLPIEKPKSLTDWLRSRFPTSSREDREMQDAIDYLTEWGKDFWLETEFRVKEITQKVESDLSSTAEASLTAGSSSMGAKFGFGSQSVASLSDEERVELCKRGQDVISKAQIRDLQTVMDMLGKVLAEGNRDYFVLIDRLDEGWVEDRLRYRLIMSLLETAKDFIKIDHAKVIVSIRRDLIERVFKITRGSGFQQEKFDSLYLPITWTREQLLSLLDLRVDRLVRSSYTKRKVTHNDLLPKQAHGKPITDHLLNRCPRPRDVIAFFNACIQTARDSPKLTADNLKEAEGEYSRGRLRALADEWSSDYPSLLDYTVLLQKRRQGFEVKSIETAAVEDLALSVAIQNETDTDLLGSSAKAVVDCVTTAEEFRLLLVKVFYQIGLIGLKLQTYESISWTDERGRGLSSAEINGYARAYIHPMYHRVLGIRTR